MKLLLSLFLLVTVAIGMSCNKANVLPKPKPAVITDAQTILLKDIEAEHLPNPYFHFEYDNHNFVKQIGFASSYFVYNVEYERGRVKKMINIPNNNTLEYSYANKRVSEINEFSGRTGLKVYSYRFSYDDSSRLKQALWVRFANNGSNTVFKKAELKYSSDGNLSVIDFYYADASAPDQLVWSSREEFSDYDDKKNVDDIAIMKDFFSSYLFLPQVKFQKNNPLKHHITSAQNEYDISYSYEYNDDLPTKRTGFVLQTRGGGDGQPIEVTNVYSYY